MGNVLKRHEEAVKSFKDNMNLSDIERLEAIDGCIRGLLSISSRMAIERNRLAQVFNDLEISLQQFQGDIQRIIFDTYKLIVSREIILRNNIYTINEQAIGQIKNFQDRLDN